MARLTRQPEEIARVRENILKNALELIVKGGYQALTMRSLASKCGMTAANLYNYYANKDALFLALVINGYGELLQQMTDALSNARDESKRAHGLMMAYVSFGVNNRGYYELMFSQRTPRHRDFVGTDHEEMADKEHQLSLQVVELAVQLVTELSARGTKEGDIRRRVMHTWALLHGLVSLQHRQVLDYVIDDPEAEFGSLIDEYIALALQIGR